MRSAMDTRPTAPCKRWRQLPRTLDDHGEEHPLRKASIEQNNSFWSSLLYTTRRCEGRRHARYTPPDMIEVHGRPHRLRPLSSFWQRRHTVRQNAGMSAIV